MPYIGKAPSSGIRSRFIYTATAGQTTFTGADDNNKTLGYTDSEYVDVYLNGVLLEPADYTATSKTSVVLDSGAAVGDTDEIVYDTFNGTFSGDVSVGGDLTVDTSTLKVDSTNNRVGVGTASPDTALHIMCSGVPSEINSSNSNAFKQEFSDNGTTRGFIGANSANAFMVGDASGSTLLAVASSGYFRYQIW